MQLMKLMSGWKKNEELQADQVASPPKKEAKVEEKESGFQVT